MIATELQGWLRLSLIQELGAVRIKRLFEHFNSSLHILSVSEAELTQAGFSPVSIASFKTILHQAPDSEQNRNIARSLAWAEKENQHIVTLGSADYPALLREIHDPPPILFVCGDKELLAFPQLAMVGSRKPSADGRRNARQFAQAISKAGYLVCSGMALGIDTESHCGALAAGAKTIAVLGTGLDCLYPKSNQNLAREIINSGAIVSEFMLGTQPEPWNFPKRNRIISGLSHGVLVVEATKKSGSLITARLAMEQGREVFALPGSIHNPAARGCHHLINTGARLVETLEDITAELMPFVELQKQQLKMGSQQGQKKNGAKKSSQKSTAHKLSKEAAQVLNEIAFEPVSINLLATKTNIEISIINVIVMELELAGIIQSLPGEAGTYRLTSPAIDETIHT